MNKSQSILVADDDPDAITLLREAVAEAGLTNELIVMHDGQEAMNYLTAHPDERFGLLLLDLKMPRAGGFDVLTWLADRPELKSMPVIVLSASSMEEDKDLAANLGADAYHTKPVAFSEFVKLVQAIQQRWMPSS